MLRYVGVAFLMILQSLFQERLILLNRVSCKRGVIIPQTFSSYFIFCCFKVTKIMDSFRHILLISSPDLRRLFTFNLLHLKDQLKDQVINHKNNQQINNLLQPKFLTVRCSSLVINIAHLQRYLCPGESMKPVWKFLLKNFICIQEFC